MRVFVAGATGVLGRALLPQLTTAGHEVIGMARTPERAALKMENIARSPYGPVCLLRIAAFLSADAWHTQQSVLALKRGLLPIIGEGANYVSQIHAFAAAQAVLCALANPDAAQGETFHVSDDEPAPMRDIFPYVAKLLHAPAPRHVSPFIARTIVGACTVELLTASYRMSNAKINRALGFTPRFPSYRESWQEVLREL